MGLTREQGRDIARLYKEMYGSLYTYAYGILREKELSEELVQETFQIACDKPMELLSGANPRGWLMNTLKNVMWNARRKRATLAKYIVAAETVDIDQIVSPDPSSNIDLMYSDLIGEAEFRLVKRIAVDRYTMLEAAEELGISVETCKKRVQRAKAKLRKHFDELGVP